MLNWLKNKLAREELAALERFRAYAAQAGQWLASMPECVEVIDYLWAATLGEKNFNQIGEIRGRIDRHRIEFLGKYTGKLQKRCNETEKERDELQERFRISEIKRIKLEKQVGQLQGTVSRMAARLDRRERNRG